MVDAPLVVGAHPHGIVGVVETWADKMWTPPLISIWMTFDFEWTVGLGTKTSVFTHSIPGYVENQCCNNGLSTQPRIDNESAYDN